MKELAVQIVRCVDDEHQPGWIECEFADAEGRRHTIVDKIPIFSMDPTLDPLDGNTKYPQPGGVACEILDAWHDPQGRKLDRITVDRPGMSNRLRTYPSSLCSSQLSELSLTSQE